jgi:predicted GTPase
MMRDTSRETAFVRRLQREIEVLKERNRQLEIAHQDFSEKQADKDQFLADKLAATVSIGNAYGFKQLSEAARMLISAERENRHMAKSEQNMLNEQSRNREHLRSIRDNLLQIEDALDDMGVPGDDYDY